MKIQSKFVVAVLAWLLVSPTNTVGQDLSLPTASFDPCRGGAANAQISAEIPPTLEKLVQASELIIIGRVATVLPAVLNNPEFVYVTETHSLIAVREVLHGRLPLNTNTVVIHQLGGQVGRCKVVVDQDPLVQFNEEYILFLRADTRTYPVNTSGSPRYDVVGVWSGRVKLAENGRIQIAPAAHQRLRQYDNNDVNSFLALLRNRIAIIYPRR